MDEPEQRSGPPHTRELVYLKAAFLAMEPAACVISLAIQSGGGSLTDGVQSFIMDNCIKYIMYKNSAVSHTYARNILKKVISTSESSGNEVLEDMYQLYAHYVSSFQENTSLKDTTKICKHISFLFPDGCDQGHWRSNFVVPLHCSSNMLEGDTGCSIWPSSLFLSEFILTYPSLFCNKFCLEVGAGVGLVGIILNKVKSSKVILTDGDLSTLANMKANLDLNGLRTDNEVECKYLSWEAATESELTSYTPDAVLGADIIYDPLCLPHLVRVLACLLKPKKLRVPHSCEEAENGGGSDHQIEVRKSNFSQQKLESHDSRESVAYITTFIRTMETFNFFLGLARQANLSVVDITEERKPLNFLPYMVSYDRACVKLYMVSYSQS